MNRSDRTIYLIAGLLGAAIWQTTAIVSGRREAWDSTLYWTLAYPACLVIVGVLGYIAPARPWRWALVLMLAQAVTLAVFASSFGLLPLGMILFGVLAIPPAIVASMGAALRKWRRSV